MDTLAHLLWTLIFFYKTKYLPLGLIIAVMPDILSWGMYVVYRIFKHLPFGKPNLSSIPKWVFTLYGITHSIFVFALVGVIVFIIWKEWVIVLLPWLIHILMDIPTHTREFLGTPFLWPFSEWVFPGTSWGSLWFMSINYSLILLLILLTILRKKNIILSFFQ